MFLIEDSIDWIGISDWFFLPTQEFLLSEATNFQEITNTLPEFKFSDFISVDSEANIFLRIEFPRHSMGSLPSTGNAEVYHRVRNIGLT